jgi:hypothetical protein
MLDLIFIINQSTLATEGEKFVSRLFDCTFKVQSNSLLRNLYTSATMIKYWMYGVHTMDRPYGLSKGAKAPHPGF